MNTNRLLKPSVILGLCMAILGSIASANPEIVVEQPAGIAIADGGARDFGTVNPGSSATLTFIIRNTGSTSLTGLGITKDGQHMADFAVGILGATALAPSASTSFSVTLFPYSSGKRWAAIHISSSDGDESQFDINLTGTGAPFGYFDYERYGVYGAGYMITGYTGPGGAVEIPDTINGGAVTAIGYFSSGWNKAITSVTIPASVTSIGYAFSGCPELTAITVAAGNPNYGSVNGVLFNKSLTTLIQYPAGKSGAYQIPASVTTVGDNAFGDCNGLTSVAIPASVTSIGQGAFLDCSGLTSVTIPASLTSIGGNAFGSCVGLTAITVAAGNPNYGGVNGVLFNKSLTTLIQYPAGISGDYSIPTSVTSIGRGAFGGSTKLTSVAIPTSVTSIDSGAFGGSTKLTSVAIPTSVTSIGDHAFRDCSGLTSVTIPTSVTRIASFTFAVCSSLTSVVIPASVTSIDCSAFMDCGDLTTISVAAANPVYSSSNGVLFDKDHTTLIYYPEGRQGGYSVPSGVTSIDNGAFFYCAGLTSATIPASVTIGAQAFSGCAGLTAITVDGRNANYTSIDGVLFNKERTELLYYPDGRQGAYSIPSGVDSIGEGAFAGCAGLSGVTIPTGVTSIGAGAFFWCVGLTSVTIPASVTTIGGSAFASSPGLSSFTFKGDAPDINMSVSYESGSAFSVYYVNGASGFSTPVWQGCPAVPLSATQEIALSGGPLATSLNDGGRFDFGPVNSGAGLVRSFTVTNVGVLDLSGLAITKDGANSGDFTVGTPGATTLAAGASTTFDVTFSPNAAGLRDAAIHIVSNDADESSYDLQLAGSGVVTQETVAAAIDQPEAFTAGSGQNAWMWQTKTTHDGTDAARSGIIAANQSSSFSFTTTGPCEVSFWWKVSSCYGFGVLQFYIDGVEQSGRITGEVDWQQRSHTVSAGSHVLRWTYFKDGYESSGLDCGWVDQILIGPVPEIAKIAVEQPAGTDLAAGIEVSVGGGGVGIETSLTYVVRNKGTANLNGLAVTKDGPHAADFTIGPLGAVFLVPGASTTFSVTFMPSLPGWRSAAIRIASDNNDVVPFEFSLIGTGLSVQEIWRQTYFGSSANTGNGADVADPDNDGLNNLLEYAFGLHPKQNSAHLAPKWQHTGGNLTCEFGQPAGVGDITYSAEWSPSLVSGLWQPIADTGVAPQHTFSMPIDGRRRKFVRLRITSGVTN